MSSSMIYDISAYDFLLSVYSNNTVIVYFGSFFVNYNHEFLWFAARLFECEGWCTKEQMFRGYYEHYTSWIVSCDKCTNTDCMEGVYHGPVER